MHLKESGMTLIELMMALAIVAILASIAVPSYQSYMVAARRADATIALQRVAAAQEQYFFTHNEYTDNAGNELGLGTGGVINSNEGYYSIAITPAGSNSTYTLTATPVAGSVQERDTDCASITLEHTGAKGSSPKGVDVCWRR